jgi:hypothetical protein
MRLCPESQRLAPLVFPGRAGRKSSRLQIVASLKREDKDPKPMRTGRLWGLCFAGGLFLLWMGCGGHRTHRPIYVKNARRGG